MALPGRRGLSISDEILHRDPSTQHEPHPDVVRAWTTVVSGGDPALVDLRFCGRALTRIAEGYAEYKHLHLVATTRSFGHRHGTRNRLSGEPVSDLTILALSGSLRKESLNTRLLNSVARFAPPELTFDVFTDLAAIPPFNEDDEHPAPPAVADLRRRICAAGSVPPTACSSRRRSTTAPCPAR
ncbi:NAD(P)H-dependent oxidoreductase [Amycolatopsis carbonis]|uniref:NAD(P)H-dependent oxidoreductase n=1 Tax=Amycolatopsis carbonis TaxID=715471 RepID=A0A9Y2IR85_9PSEU|nr:NAD(P)H-dependent oxidoreductase [Amycolatopsis sp. 2-15]WIX83706.1 NAD(P)H-dependent oxidoreductase [Amycolatopsis sp. 2-15]